MFRCTILGMDTQPAFIDYAFEPDTIQPGVYVTTSATPAYAGARFLVESGKAIGVDRYLPGGQIELTFEVMGQQRGPRKNPPDGEEGFERSGSVKVTKKWLKTRTREYENFKTAWWRESIQNSINPHTGNATRVDLICRELPDKTWVVSCSDNGRGMTREQVEDEEKGFLVFGGSGASQYGSMGGIGGFGEAKQLLIFPWLQYRLLTADQEYIGQGADWKARTVTPRKGVMLEVIMPEDAHTTPEDALHVLVRSWLPHVTFTLNGKVVATKIPTPEQALKEVPGQGIIYSYPKIRNEAPEIVVRKGGLWTFSQELPPSAKHGIIVEVTGESTRMFTTNRDGFSWNADKLKKQLASDIKEMTTEGRLRAKLKPVERIVRGTGKFKTFEQKRTEEVPERAFEMREAVGGLPVITQEPKTLPPEVVDQVVKKIEKFNNQDWEKLGEMTPEDGAGSDVDSAAGMAAFLQIAAASPAAAAAILEHMKFTGQKSMDAAIKQMVWKPDFYLIKDADMAYVIPKKFQPETMTPAILRLTKIWAELCRFILISMGVGTPFGVGFWFSDDAAAGYLFRKDEHWLLLNPHKNQERTEVYIPGNQEDLAFLWAAAIHEVSHMIVRLEAGHGYEDDDSPPEPASHGSEMSNMQTRVQAKLATAWLVVKKIVSGIKLRGTAEQITAPKIGRKPPPGRKAKRAPEEPAGERVERPWNDHLAMSELIQFLETFGKYVYISTDENRMLAAHDLGVFMSRLTYQTWAEDTERTGYGKMVQDLYNHDRGYKNGIALVLNARDWSGDVPNLFKVEFVMDPSKIPAADRETIHDRLAELSSLQSRKEQSETHITWIDHGSMWSSYYTDGITVDDKSTPAVHDDWDRAEEAFAEIRAVAAHLPHYSTNDASEYDRRELAQENLERFVTMMFAGTSAQRAFFRDGARNADDPAGVDGSAIDHILEYGKDYSDGVLLEIDDKNKTSQIISIALKDSHFKKPGEIEMLRKRLMKLYEHFNALDASDQGDINILTVSMKWTPFHAGILTSLPHVPQSERENPAPAACPCAQPKAFGDLIAQPVSQSNLKVWGLLHRPTGNWVTKRQTRDSAMTLAQSLSEGDGKAILESALGGDQDALDQLSQLVSGEKN